MSREIKLKVWDGDFMHGPFTILDLFKDRLGTMDLKNSLRIIRKENIKWLLWSGRKDRNGNEIFEGDIVRVVGAESGEMVVHVDDITMMPLSTLYPAGEVIGNIFEHPELLRGSHE